MACGTKVRESRCHHQRYSENPQDQGVIALARKIKVLEKENGGWGGGGGRFLWMQNTFESNELETQGPEFFN